MLNMFLNTCKIPKSCYYLSFKIENVSFSTSHLSKHQRHASEKAILPVFSETKFRADNLAPCQNYLELKNQQEEQK